jgi:hypothetical protein
VEIDIVVAHPAHGIGIIEVKGFTPKIVTGQWITPYKKKNSSPAEQMKNNRFALRDFLRQHIADAPHIRVDAAIAFVNARGFAGDTRPTDVQPHELIWADDRPETTRGAPRVGGMRARGLSGGSNKSGADKYQENWLMSPYLVAPSWRSVTSHAILKWSPPE